MERKVVREMEQHEAGRVETETKQLTVEGFDDFTSILEEVNEEALAPEVKERLKQDFAEGRFKGFQVYEEGGIAGLAVVVDTYSAVHARKVLQLD